MIKYTFMLVGSFIVRFLPLRLAYAVAKTFGWIAYRLFGNLRRVAGDNLSVIFSEGLTDSKKNKLIKNLFVHMALNAVDFLRFPYATYPKPLIEIEGNELLQELYREGKGVILVSPHLGNWEVGGMILAQFGFSVNVVTESIRPKKSWFKKDRIANLYRRYREKVGMKTIPLEESGIREFKALKRGEMLVLVADRDISGSGIEVEFFGMRGRIPKGPAVLALRSGAPIVFGICVRRPDGRLHALLEPVDYDSENVYDITKLLVKKMEKYIRQYPDQWFVFQPPWG